jgi:hypothetical protein
MSVPPPTADLVRPSLHPHMSDSESVLFVAVVALMVALALTR